MRERIKQALNSNLLWKMTEKEYSEQLLGKEPLAAMKDRADKLKKLHKDYSRGYMTQKEFYYQEDYLLEELVNAYLFGILRLPASEREGCVARMEEALSPLKEWELLKSILSVLAQLMDGTDGPGPGKLARLALDKLLALLHTLEPERKMRCAYEFTGFGGSLTLLTQTLAVAAEGEYPFRQEVRVNGKTFPVTSWCALRLAVGLAREATESALSFARHALFCEDPEDRARAFHYYGWCCTELKDLQGAYDAYTSWIRRETVGSMSAYQVKFDDADALWRQQDGYQLARMFENKSNVCAAIAAQYPQEHPKGKAFLRRAVKYAKAAYETRESKDQSSDILVDICRCKYARLLHKNGDTEEALALFPTEQEVEQKGYGQCALEIELRTELLYGKLEDALSLDMGILMEHDVTPLLRELREQAGEKQEDYVDILNAWEKMELGSQTQPGSTAARLLHILVGIHHTAAMLRDSLRCLCLSREYYLRDKNDEKYAAVPARPMPIAYYTTLDNAAYLFQKVYQPPESPRPRPVTAEDPQKEAKNCLTMMHAYYMNDPNEGLTLLTELSQAIDDQGDTPNLLFRRMPPMLFREQLYDRQFVFLKSFTNVVDQLNMWSMYASDRTEGSDSNGCCVRIAPETFQLMQEMPEPVSAKKAAMEQPEKKDDYQLYEVAYIRSGEIIGAKENRKLTLYYDRLKKLFVLLNDLLHSCRPVSQQDMDILHGQLQKALAPIVFLFKDDSYRAEQERRIIVTRSRDELDKISTTAQNPPKLFINPYHQVYAEEIILGPKVEDPDHYIPHLQYELAKMWSSWPREQFGDRVPKVRKSSIHYRD